jgi:uncharacterized membrane protein YphA (DoxX/SURF4 family)
MVIDLLRDPVWLTACSLGLALLFGAAGWHKLRNQPVFTAILHGYALLPERLVRPASMLLPWLEMSAAVGLLIPVSQTFAALLAAALLLAYAAAMALSLLKGQRIADCGCHFGEQRQAVSAALVWRNLLLSGLALSLLQAPLHRTMGIYDGLTIGAALVCACVLYLLANTLIANQQTARELSL